MYSEFYKYMKMVIRIFQYQRFAFFAISTLAIATLFTFVGSVYANSDIDSIGARLVTFHDRGEKHVILTHSDSVRDAIEDAGIDITPEDKLEPAINSQLVAQSYSINIYRARPVIVVDGIVREKIMTSSQTAEDIVSDAKISALQQEDIATFSVSDNIVSDGASTVLTVKRATAFTLQMYGTPIATYSHAKTVGEMLEQKGVELASDDTLSVDANAPLTAGMTVEIWREGAQTATIDEPIAFPVRKVLDFDHPVGYSKIQTPGKTGVKSVTYEIVASSGREISRNIIQSVVVSESQEQVEIVGAKPGAGALSKSKGAQYYIDSKGISHRETYYDLPMNIVMGKCGGGDYTVRVDGAKVDKDGYILVAANYGNYPPCTVVETSMGPGKVYDTGGFAVRHPHGFDLATDWTNNNGR